jgi:transposase
MQTGTLHRVRERWIIRRVALTNQIRGFLLERGIPVRVGSENLWKVLLSIVENAENGLTGRSRTLLSTLRQEWVELEAKIVIVTEELGRISRSNEGCKRLMGVPGIGPIISTALVAAVGKCNIFPKRPGPRLLVRTRSATVFLRRENKTAGYQQTRQ